MRALEELKDGKMPHLFAVKRVEFPRELLDFKVFTGRVSLNDFEGSAVFGYDEGHLMEHVSVSHRNPHRLPSWDVMCRIKDMFFYPEEMVVQLHPPGSLYFHGFRDRDNVLHLWRPMNGDFSILNDPERWC